MNDSTQQQQYVNDPTQQQNYSNGPYQQQGDQNDSNQDQAYYNNSYQNQEYPYGTNQPQTYSPVPYDQQTSSSNTTPNSANGSWSTAPSPYQQSDYYSPCSSQDSPQQQQYASDLMQNQACQGQDGNGGFNFGAAGDWAQNRGLF
jgi:hypothetical protein